MPVPDQIEVDRVDAKVLVGGERSAPAVVRDALVEKRRAVNEKRPSVDAKNRIAAFCGHACGAPRRPRRRGSSSERRRREKERYKKHRRERPPAFLARRDEKNESSYRKPAEAQCNRTGAGTGKCKRPSCKRDECGERVERHSKRRPDLARSEQHERKDLRDSLDEHDSCG